VADAGRGVAGPESVVADARAGRRTCCGECSGLLKAGAGTCPSIRLSRPSGSSTCWPNAAPVAGSPGVAELAGWLNGLVSFRLIVRLRLIKYGPRAPLCHLHLRV